MKRIELDRLHGETPVVNLLPGMAWALYVDDGPGGPCGQGMRTTCPHASLHVFSSQYAMETAVATGLGRNKKAKVFYGVVDEFSSPGVVSIVIHDTEPTE